MSEGNGQSPQVEYLRRLGHDEAADALQAADALIPHEPEPGTAHGAPAPERQRQSTAADPEAQRRAEGEAMMRALRESIPGIYDDR